MGLFYLLCYRINDCPGLFLSHFIHHGVQMAQTHHIYHIYVVYVTLVIGYRWSLELFVLHVFISFLLMIMNVLCLLLLCSTLGSPVLSSSMTASLIMSKTYMYILDDFP